MRPFLAGFAEKGFFPMPGSSGGRGRLVRYWLDRVLRAACGIVLVVGAWKEGREMEFRSLFRLPVTPALGDADYAMSMAGTIGELIEREELRGKRMAVWGGSLSQAHDLPFRWRLTADWFPLPASGVPVVATAGEAVRYEYLLSPWGLGKQFEGTGWSVELMAEENIVWLYRVQPSKK